MILTLFGALPLPRSGGAVCAQEDWQSNGPRHTWEGVLLHVELRFSFGILGRLMAPTLRKLSRKALAAGADRMTKASGKG